MAAYDWRAHCRIYHRLLSDIVEPANGRPSCRRLLVCDIDNTLLGDRSALKEFLAWQADNADSIALGIATGRSFHSAQAILAAEGVPNPDVIISSVGAEIHWYDREQRAFVVDRHWSASVTSSWDAAGVYECAEKIGLRSQAALEQKVGKASFFLDDHDPEQIEAAFRSASCNVEVVASHGRYLDVLARRVGKHAAVYHAAQKLGLNQAQVVVAGDSGNDRAMLRACPYPIVVGNWSDGIADDPSLSHAYIASATHAAGILEGVRHYQGTGTW